MADPDRPNVLAPPPLVYVAALIAGYVLQALFSRNPMYVGVTGLLVGLALITRIGWLLILLVPVLGVMHRGVVRREERYLGRKFGSEYDAYRSRVRRYL